MYISVTKIYLSFYLSNLIIATIQHHLEPLNHAKNVVLGNCLEFRVWRLGYSQEVRRGVMLSLASDNNISIDYSGNQCKYFIGHNSSKLTMKNAGDLHFWYSLPKQKKLLYTLYRWPFDYLLNTFTKQTIQTNVGPQNIMLPRNVL